MNMANQLEQGILVSFGHSNLEDGGEGPEYDPQEGIHKGNLLCVKHDESTGMWIDSSERLVLVLDSPTTLGWDIWLLKTDPVQLGIY